MFSKKFFDILALALVLSIILLGFIPPIFIDKPTFEKRIIIGEDPNQENFSRYNVVQMYSIFALLGIYSIFIIVLAIQMRLRRLISLISTILIVALFPLDFIFYFAILRKHFKEVDDEEVSDSIISLVEYTQKPTAPITAVHNRDTVSNTITVPNEVT
ncbi:MAG: hypothetical protein IH845_04930 [Nanoarchaeota archaeon]|nr:hypothetical protein [Nanoarchaeota archaeon]